MSDELSKAARDAVDAADNTELVRTIAAVLAAQQTSQAQPPAPAPSTDRRPVGLYVAASLGGAVALTALAMAAALLAVAVAVGTVAATVCLLVLKSMFDDYRKGH
jgi:hypothetical protein